jgi:hypothetical protein
MRVTAPPSAGLARWPAWEAKQAALPYSKRLRRRLGYPDPPPRAEPFEEPSAAYRQPLPPPDGYHVEDLGSIFGALDATPGGWRGGYSILAGGARRKSPVWVRAGQLLDDAFDRSSREPILTSELQCLAAVAGISWSQVVAAGKSKGVTKRKRLGSGGRWYWFP